MKEISAGGVVYKNEGQGVKVLLIEDRYHKLTIPKGKQELGETLAQTAIREIEEETGIKGTIMQPLHTVYYQYTHPEKGVIDKEVTYFLVEAIGGTIQPQIEEINKVYWLEMHDAWDAQKNKGYENNQEIFTRAYEHLQRLGS